MSKIFRVLYDFSAEDEGELSVRAGQLVMLKEGGPPGTEGWTLVQTTTTPLRYGFVPSDYLQSTIIHNNNNTNDTSSSSSASATASANDNALHGTESFLNTNNRTTTSPGNFHSSFLQPSSSSSNPLLSSTYSSYSTNNNNNFGSSTAFGNTNTTASSSSAAAEEFGQLFASHEEWFKAATQKRKEIYGQLLNEATDISRALQEAEAKSLNVLNRVHELEKVIQDEKTRWQQKLAEDNVLSA